MACASCAKKRANSSQDFRGLENPPFRANDIFVFNTDSKIYRKFNENDWDAKKINVLFMTPNLASLNINGYLQDYEDRNMTIVTSDSMPQVIEDAENGIYTGLDVFVSYLLPSRLNLMRNGSTRRAVVVIMPDGDTITQELYYESSFDLEYINNLIDEYKEKRQA